MVGWIIYLKRADPHISNVYAINRALEGVSPVCGLGPVSFVLSTSRMMSSKTPQHLGGENPEKNQADVMHFFCWKQITVYNDTCTQITQTCYVYVLSVNFLHLPTTSSNFPTCAFNDGEPEAEQHESSSVTKQRFIIHSVCGLLYWQKVQDIVGFYVHLLKEYMVLHLAKLVSSVMRINHRHLISSCIETGWTASALTEASSVAKGDTEYY